MKKGVAVIACLFLILIISSSFVSAGFFSDLWNRITGKAVGDCTDTDATTEFPDGKNFFVKGETCQDGSCYEDSCLDSNSLIEYYCYQGVMLPVKETCANGCDEGACVGEECILDCAGKECGSDGCGGSCGLCSATEYCISGNCDPDCVPVIEICDDGTDNDCDGEIDEDCAEEVPDEPVPSGPIPEEPEVPGEDEDELITYIIQFQEPTSAERESEIKQKRNTLVNENVLRKAALFGIQQDYPEGRVKPMSVTNQEDELTRDISKAEEHITKIIYNKEDLIDQQETDIEDEQNSFKSRLLRNPSITGNAVSDFVLEDIILSEWNTALNGMAVRLTPEQAEDIADYPEVKSIHESRTLEINQVSEPNEYLDVDDVWEYDDEGYSCFGGDDCITGKGIKVAVLDSGIDYTHIDFGECELGGIYLGQCDKIKKVTTYSRARPFDFDGDGDATACYLQDPNGAFCEIDYLIDKGKIEIDFNGDGDTEDCFAQSWIGGTMGEFTELYLGRDIITPDGIGHDLNRDGDMFDSYSEVSWTTKNCEYLGYDFNRDGDMDECYYKDNYGTICESENPDIMDYKGHGTHIAGIIAADGLKKGVAPDVELYVYGTMDHKGGTTESIIISSVEDAINDDVDIISISMGDFDHRSSSFSEDIDKYNIYCELVNNAVKSGILFVTSAGNFGGLDADTGRESTISLPGACKDALTVGMAFHDYENLGRSYAPLIPGASSRGPVEYPDSETGETVSYFKPDIVAPGFEICSTMSKYDSSDKGCSFFYESYYGDHNYVEKKGTSMATPYVSGVAALMLQMEPSLTPQEVKDILMETALDEDDIPEFVLEFDENDRGAGIVNAKAAVDELIRMKNEGVALGESDGIDATYADRNCGGVCAVAAANDLEDVRAMIMSGEVDSDRIVSASNIAGVNCVLETQSFCEGGRVMAQHKKCVSGECQFLDNQGIIEEETCGSTQLACPEFLGEPASILGITPVRNFYYDEGEDIYLHEKSCQEGITGTGDSWGTCDYVEEGILYEDCPANICAWNDATQSPECGFLEDGETGCHGEDAACSSGICLLRGIWSDICACGETDAVCGLSECVDCTQETQEYCFNGDVWAVHQICSSDLFGNPICSWPSDSSDGVLVEDCSDECSDVSGAHCVETAPPPAIYEPEEDEFSGTTGCDECPQGSVLTNNNNVRRCVVPSQSFESRYLDYRTNWLGRYITTLGTDWTSWTINSNPICERKICLDWSLIGTCQSRSWRNTVWEMRRS
jgi:subtilisin family serine protease